MTRSGIRPMKRGMERSAIHKSRLVNMGGRILIWSYESPATYFWYFFAILFVRGWEKICVETLILTSMLLLAPIDQWPEN